MNELKIDVYDMDGTIVDSTAALRQCQVEGLQRATGQDLATLEQLLEEKGFIGALKEVGIDRDAFFKQHYKTFDPYLAASEGRMSVFPDARGRLTSRPTITQFLISNSSIDATHRKLDAVSIDRLFGRVYAEFEKDKGKPTPYMAEQLAWDLAAAGYLPRVTHLNHVGDMAYDLEFGEVLHDVISTRAQRNIPFNNYLIDREKTYKGEVPKHVKVISSLEMME